MIKKEYPNWLIDACNAIDLKNYNANKITGGSVGESWKVSTIGDCRFFKKTLSPISKAGIKEKILLSEAIKPFLPSKYRFDIIEDGYVQSYTFCRGSVLTTFDVCMDDLFEICTMLHNTQFFEQQSSSYLDIFNEILFLSSYNINLLPIDIRKSVDYSINYLKVNLSHSLLSNMFDNRGVLTHGDIKPANIICRNKNLILIDWDKACSVSPEFEIAYVLYTGVSGVQAICDTYKSIRHLFNIGYSRNLFIQSLNCLPHLYFIHDVYKYITQQNNTTYLFYCVYPLYKTWFNRRYMIWSELLKT